MAVDGGEDFVEAECFVRVSSILFSAFCSVQTNSLDTQKRFRLVSSRLERRSNARRAKPKVVVIDGLLFV